MSTNNNFEVQSNQIAYLTVENTVNTVSYKIMIFLNSNTKISDFSFKKMEKVGYIII